VSAVRIARWKPGTWEALGPSFSLGEVQDIVAWDDGGGEDIYATGNGSLFDDIARWDGSSWTPLGEGLSSEAYCLVVHDDGAGESLWAGGLFLSAGGKAAKRIARWDGGEWFPTGVGLATTAFAMCSSAVGGSPALYVVHPGWTPGETGETKLARWQGGAWSSFGDAGSANVQALVEFDDGSGPALYLGGSFSSIDGVPANSIAKFDGTSWSDVGGGVNSLIYDLDVVDDGSGPALWACGIFTLAGGVAVNKVARWDGSSWSDVGGGLPGSGSAWEIEEYDSGSGPEVYVAGNFNTLGGSAGDRIARWDGSSWGPVGAGISGSTARALAVFDDGTGAKLIAGGVFASASGVANTNNLAAWDGTSWSSIGGTEPYLTWTVAQLLVAADGSGCALYACGFFDEIGSTPLANIGRYDGATWTPLGSGVDQDTTTADVMVVHDEGLGDGPRLVVAGSFTTLSDTLPTPASHIATWGGCCDGVSAWTDLGFALSGVSGDPLLEGTGSLSLGSINTLDLSNAAPSATAGLFLAFSSTPTAFAGGTIVPFPFLPPIIVTTSPLGTLPLTYVVDECFPPAVTLYAQWVIDDAAAVSGYAISNAVVGVTP
jgi:hypothetical protein